MSDALGMTSQSAMTSPPVTISPSAAPSPQATNPPTTCRLCGATRIRCLGTLPDSDYFAGRVLPQPIAGGRLWRCEACASMFRHPILTDSAYLALYAQGAADEWQADEGRQDLSIIRKMIAAAGVGAEIAVGVARGVSAGAGVGTVPARVLDVGCGSGDFLLSLPAEVAKFGIEPSVAAAAAAEHRGVCIAAPTLDDLPATGGFDVITMIDVIEHVALPQKLLDAALPHLSPGGRLIIATGDPGHTLWRRVFGSRFWYSSFPEHISFPSLEFFNLWQRGKGLQTPTAVQLQYRRLPLITRSLHFVSQLVFLASPALLNTVARGIDAFRRTSRHTPRPRRFFSPGAPGVFTDHQIVVIRRPP